jgi:myo-inositol-1(or 4)-monophosphatase
MALDLARVCLQGIEVARNTLEVEGEAGREEVYKPGEPLTKSDLAISKALKEFFTNSGLPAVIYDEEMKGEPFFTCNNPEYNIYIDPLDGTFNYQRGGLLPSTTVISAFRHSEHPKFKDAVFAAVMDLKTKNLWYAEKGAGCFFNGKKARTSGRKDIGAGKSCFVMIDHGPCTNDIEIFKDIYSSTWAHNVSSAGFHLAGVASGHFDAFVGPVQKAHELGAGYLLVKEAGGEIIDFYLRPINNLDFNFNSLYEIIAAATFELAGKLKWQIG